MVTNIFSLNLFPQNYDLGDCLPFIKQKAGQTACLSLSFV
jgi:hypothetical protein